jgi:hypothetical protein
LLHEAFAVMQSPSTSITAQVAGRLPADADDWSRPDPGLSGRYLPYHSHSCSSSNAVELTFHPPPTV